MRHGLLVLRLLPAIVSLCAACAPYTERQDGWQGPMDAFAQRQLAAGSRRLHAAAPARPSTGPQPGARRLLTPSRQSALTAAGSGTLEYRPIGYSIDGADLSQFFLEAHANPNVTGIKLGPGTYHVTAKAEDGYHINLACSQSRHTPFEIDFTSVFLYFTDHQSAGTQLSNCEHVDFHGPYEQTWVSSELGFTQGAILEMDWKSDPMTMTIQVDDGYPSDRIMLKENLNSWTFTNDTLLVRNDPCPSITTPENLDHRAKIGSNQYRFPFTYSDWVGCASEPGDLLVVCGDSTGNNKGLHLSGCNHTYVHDVTIYHAGSFAIFQEGGSNNTFEQNQVRPFPRPLGRDGKLPLLSSCADSFHAVNGHRGTVLRDNFFVNAGDDGIAMHGEYLLVAAVDSSKHTIIVAAQSFPFGKNDTLVFYGRDTQYKGTADIADLYSVKQPDSTAGKQTTSMGNPQGFQSYDDLDFLEVKFTSWPSSFNDVLFDDVVSCPSANGNGFAILNNTVGNLRGRAALIKSSNGVVAGNTFFNLMNWAVEMAPEYRFSEADFVHGILFADNVINSNGSGIWIGIDPWKWGIPPSYTNNYAVDFIGNTIVNTQRSPFVVTSSAQICIQNTTFVNVLCHSNTTTALGFYWQEPGSVIFLANVDDITFSGNHVVTDQGCLHPFGNYEHPVSMYNASNIFGLHPQAQPIASFLARDPKP